MHAIRLHEFGPADNLRWEEVDDPAPRGSEVLIDVTASGVHLLDTSIRRGTATGPFPLPDLPAIPGREVAGVVAAVGDDVDEAWVGRHVVAHLGQASRGYAERVVTDAGRLHVLPDGVRPAVGVAMIGTGRTALGVLDVASPAPRADSARCSSRGRCARARRCSARPAARRRSSASGRSVRPGWTTCDRTGTPP
jgi:NADPH2:quinone reductase